MPSPGYAAALALALAACAPSADDDRGSATAATGTAELSGSDSAEAVAVTPPPFDFRAVALAPAHVGEVRRCEVGHVDPLPVRPGVVRVHCGNGYRLIPVEVQLGEGETIARR